MFKLQIKNAETKLSLLLQSDEEPSAELMAAFLASDVTTKVIAPQKVVQLPIAESIETTSKVEPELNVKKSQPQLVAPAEPTIALYDVVNQNEESNEGTLKGAVANNSFAAAMVKASSSTPSLGNKSVPVTVNPNIVQDSAKKNGYYIADDGTRMFRCLYQCPDCGQVGRRYLAVGFTYCKCHKCEKRMRVYHATNFSLSLSTIPKALPGTDVFYIGGKMTKGEVSTHDKIFTSKQPAYSAANC